MALRHRQLCQQTHVPSSNVKAPCAFTARRKTVVKIATNEIAPVADGISNEGLSKCPFQSVASAFSQAAASPSRPETASGDTKQIPGPHPMSLESLLDVTEIFRNGLHVAMLKFSGKYGPICR